MEFDIPVYEPDLEAGIVDLEDEVCEECHSPMEGDFCFMCEIPEICSLCDSENYPIGIMGDTKHYCCRSCGIWYRR